ncbi:MAG: DPP IV N-terminal domain-containing protein [Planctomycetota bacterium]
MIRFAPRLLLAAVLAGCATPPDASLTRAPAERPDALTLDRILAQPSLTGTSPIEPTWSLDSRHLAFLWNPDGQPQREIWLANADGSGLRQLTDAPDGGSVRELAWLPSSQALVYLRSGQVWRVDLEGRSTAVALEPGDRSDLAVSPDGRLLSYLQSGDLWLVESESGLQRRATFVGEPSISDLPLGRYARPEVEIGPPIWGGPTYAWAPDSRSIAIHRVDRGHLRTVPFPHYLGPETDPNFVRRSYPGDANESRRVGILTVESGDLDSRSTSRRPSGAQSKPTTRTPVGSGRSSRSRSPLSTVRSPTRRDSLASPG